jgi:hypothetical protein
MYVYIYIFVYISNLTVWFQVYINVYVHTYIYIYLCIGVRGAMVQTQKIRNITDQQALGKIKTLGSAGEGIHIFIIFNSLRSIFMYIYIYMDNIYTNIFTCIR